MPELVLLVGFGSLLGLTVIVFMHETVTPDQRRVLPGPLLAAYRELLGNPDFVFASVTLGGSIGALYAQATLLATVLPARS
jgi:hypothetical protein